jgi:hypothetical protein
MPRSLVIPLFVPLEVFSEIPQSPGNALQIVPFLVSRVIPSHGGTSGDGGDAI